MLTTHEPLFTKAATADDLFTEKRAAALSRVPDDEKKWPQHVLSEMMRELPFLAQYDVDIVLDRTEPEAGAALGYAQVRNKTMSRPQDNVSTPGNIIRVPIIIQDRRLQRFYVFECGKQTYPLNEDRVQQAMLNPAVFDTDATRVPTSGSLIEQLYPPYNQRRGFGTVTTPDALGLSKLSSAPKTAGVVFGEPTTGGRDRLGTSAMSDEDKKTAAAQGGNKASTDAGARWKAVISTAQTQAAQQQAAAAQAQPAGKETSPKAVEDAKDRQHRREIESALVHGVLTKAEMPGLPKQRESTGPQDAAQPAAAEPEKVADGYGFLSYFANKLDREAGTTVDKEMILAGAKPPPRQDSLQKLAYIFGASHPSNAHLGSPAINQDDRVKAVTDYGAQKAKEQPTSPWRAGLTGAGVGGAVGGAVGAVGTRSLAGGAAGAAVGAGLGGAGGLLAQHADAGEIAQWQQAQKDGPDAKRDVALHRIRGAVEHLAGEEKEHRRRIEEALLVAATRPSHVEVHHHHGSGSTQSAPREAAKPTKHACAYCGAASSSNTGSCSQCGAPMSEATKMAMMVLSAMHDMEKDALSPELVQRATLNRHNKVDSLYGRASPEQANLLAQRTMSQGPNIRRMQGGAPSLPGARPAAQGGGLLPQPRINMPAAPVAAAPAVAAPAAAPVSAAARAQAGVAAARGGVAPVAHAAPVVAAAEHAAPAAAGTAAHAGQFLATHARPLAAGAAGVGLLAAGAYGAHRLMNRPQAVKAAGFLGEAAETVGRAGKAVLGHLSGATEEAAQIAGSKALYDARASSHAAIAARQAAARTPPVQASRRIQPSSADVVKGLVQQHKERMFVPKTADSAFEGALGEVAPLLGGVGVGYSPGRAAAGHTAAGIAPHGYKTRAEDVARRAAMLTGPVAGVGAYAGQRALNAGGRAAEFYARHAPHGGIVGGPSTESAIIRAGVPLLAAGLGTVAGGAATGAAVGGAARLHRDQRGG